MGERSVSVHKSMKALFGVILLTAFAAGATLPAAAGQIVKVYLPLALKGSACPTSSANSYSGGGALQYDHDDPPRPAEAHADKNLDLRGYTPTSAALSLQNLGGLDPVQPPQLAT